MTKAAEIALLDTTIESFGRDSYLGPWLRANRDALVADIRSDLPPTQMLPGQAYRLAEEIVTHAHAQAQTIRETAERKARELETKAYSEARSTRLHAAAAIERVASELRSRCGGGAA